MIQDFKESNIDLKISRFNPGLHFMDNESSTELKMAITSMDIITSWFSQVITGQSIQRDKSRPSRTIS